MTVTLFSSEQLQLLINGLFIGAGTGLGGFIVMSFFVRIIERRFGMMIKKRK